MEQTNNETSLFDLSIDEAAKNHLKNISSWVMVIVISAVIGYILAILKALQSRPHVVDSEGFGVSAKTGPNLGGVIFGIIIGLLINFFLFQFANLARKGVNRMSQSDLNAGFYNLKIYFVIIGVLLIIALIILLLAVLVVGLSAH